MHYIGLDQLTAHHAGLQIPPASRGVPAAPHPPFVPASPNAQKTIFADIGRRLALLQKSGALIFQPGQTAFHPTDTYLWADLVRALRRLLAHVGSCRERESQFHTQPVDSLARIQVTAGTQRRNGIRPLTQQKVCGSARHMKDKHFLCEQADLAGGKQCGSNMPLLVCCLQ